MVWLFDYDLTLYGTEERCVINSLDHRISLFVQKTVGGDFESAHKVRTDYLERFGTTLSGLMAMLPRGQVISSKSVVQSLRQILS